MSLPPSPEPRHPPPPDTACNKIGRIAQGSSSQGPLFSPRRRDKYNKMPTSRDERSSTWAKPNVHA